jgi:hypothetical protein
MARPKLWPPSGLRGEESNNLEDGDFMVALQSGFLRLALRENGEWVPDAFARKQDTWRVLMKTEATERDDTPALDPDLQFAVAANGRYAFRLRVYFDMDEGLGFGLYGPDGGTWRWRRSWLRYADTSDQGVALEQDLTTGDGIAIADGDGGVIQIEGVLIVGETGGTFGFAWSASAAAEATVREGSFVEYRRVQ